MGTVSVKTFVAPTSLAMTYGTSRAQGAITFSWDTASWTGEYLDGPVWVYVPSGTISMSEPTPAQTTVSTKIVNGAEKNPTNTAGTQGFDENGTGWDAGRLATFPATLTAGDVIVKAKHSTDWALPREGLVEQYASCFIVDSIPAANSFSPAAISWTGRTTKDASVVNVGAWVDANCPSYDTSGHAQVPPYAGLMTHLDKYSPANTMVGSSSQVYQELAPNNSTSSSNYGQYLGGVIAGAALALCSSSFSRDQKIAIATRLISNGKQWYDTMSNGVAFNQDGGQFQFHLVPMAIYLKATGQTSALSTLITDIPGNYAQAFQWTAAQISLLTVHSDMTLPHTWRRHNVANPVSGLDVTVEFVRSGTTGDGAKIEVGSGEMKMIRESDGAEATITSISPSDVAAIGTTPITITIDAQPTPAFAAADVVYFEPMVMPSEGDYDWSIGGANLRSYNPAPGGPYRKTNQWSGQVLSLKALGCFPADGTAVQAYVERANAANTPSASFDFPDHHASMLLSSGTKNWEDEWWTDYAATILA